MSVHKERIMIKHIHKIRCDICGHDICCQIADKDPSELQTGMIICRSCVSNLYFDLHRLDLTHEDQED